MPRGRNRCTMPYHRFAADLEGGRSRNPRARGALGKRQPGFQRCWKSELSRHERFKLPSLSRTDSTGSMGWEQGGPRMANETHVMVMRDYSATCVLPVITVRHR